MDATGHKCDKFLGIMGVVRDGQKSCAASSERSEYLDDVILTSITSGSAARALQLQAGHVIMSKYALLQTRCTKDFAAIAQIK